MAIISPSCCVRPGRLDVPKSIANKVISTQKPTAIDPWDAAGDKRSAVSATARICRAISGVTPTKITSVVTVPTHGERYLNAKRSARELS